MKYLEGVGLIRRVRVTIKDKYSYEVLNCRKSLNGKQEDGSIKMGGKTYSSKPNEEIQFLDDDKAKTNSNIEDDDDDDLA
jgi:hypothetical protein